MTALHRLLPRTLAARVVIVLVVGMMAFHAGSLWLHGEITSLAIGSTREAALAERLASARRAVAQRPMEERDAIAHALSSVGLELHWTLTPTGRIPAETSARIEMLRARLAQLIPEVPASTFRLAYQDHAADALPHLLVGALPLDDDTWLTFASALFHPPASEHLLTLSEASMALAVLGLSLLVVRQMARPLGALAVAADRIGAPGPSLPLAEDGPTEVRQVAQAFNRMQARIDALILDRTQALAAVSHDLRTPIARLRLRAGFVEDAEASRAIDADLDEMEAMIDTTLAFLRGEVQAEAMRPVDLVAMLATLCDGAADAGAQVSFVGPPQLRLVCRPLALKRAFGNLIGNACKYGQGARVTLSAEPGMLTLTVEDDGPGIPEAAMETVFEPYRRLETSRNRGTGGVGLGLAITRQAVAAHGGQVTLENRTGGGLTARVQLPRATAG